MQLIQFVMYALDDNIADILENLWPEEFERDAAAEAVSSRTHDAAVMKYFTPTEPQKSLSGSTDPIDRKPATIVSSP